MSLASQSTPQTLAPLFSCYELGAPEKASCFLIDSSQPQTKIVKPFTMTHSPRGKDSPGEKLVKDYKHSATQVHSKAPAFQASRCHRQCPGQNEPSAGHHRESWKNAHQSFLSLALDTANNICSPSASSFFLSFPLIPSIQSPICDGLDPLKSKFSSCSLALILPCNSNISHLTRFLCLAT